jgi:hypothetical protein
MPAPFAVVRRDGIVWIDRQADAAFRKALTDGVPTVLRPKMIEALAATPDRGAMAHSIRYFGDELEQIKQHIAPLLVQLNKYLSEQMRMPGLFDWLDITNFGNDYRMIKVFKAWSEMRLGGAHKPGESLLG